MSLFKNKVAEIEYLKDALKTAQEKLDNAMDLQDLELIGRKDIAIGSKHLLRDIERYIAKNQLEMKCQIHKITFHLPSLIRIEYRNIKKDGELYKDPNVTYFDY